MLTTHIGLYFKMQCLTKNLGLLCIIMYISMRDSDVKVDG